MENDVDMKLYNEYLSGEKTAFELLYNKYKERVKYFVFNIVKDYEKAEDIVQEVFIYILQNKIKEGYTFKSYLYLVAKSRALSYLQIEKRRTEINEEYIFKDEIKVQDDIDEIISKKEEKSQLLEAINLLDERYKNAIYLTKIEEISYQETAGILGESIQNVKNLVHRGKFELRKILIKKGFKEMNKGLKVLILGIVITVAVSGIAYGATVAYQKYRSKAENNTNHKISMNPAYKSTLDENTVNNLWVGTLDLAWKKLEDEIGQNKINLVEGNPSIVDELNNSNFTKEMLDSNDYEIKLEKNLTGGYNIDTSLNKELNFLEPFDNFSKDYTNLTFGDDEENIKYFGVNNASLDKMDENIEILFYNKISDENSLSDDFAIKLKTKEGDEIILYRTDDKKSFNEYYDDIQTKTNSYTGTREFSGSDELRIPYIRLNGMIAYNELYGKNIKGTANDAMYFENVVQNVNFSLNEKGCNLSSKLSMVTEYLGIGSDTKYCYFTDTFILFMKEKECDEPYFALKVDNSDILEKIEETDEPKITDYTMMQSSYMYNVEERRI